MCIFRICFQRRLDGTKSGQADIVVAGGIEKMNDLSPERKRFWLGVSGDTEWERLAGLTLEAFNVNGSNIFMSMAIMTIWSAVKPSTWFTQ